MKEKCCGTCKYFYDEDVNGEGFCTVKDSFESSSYESNTKRTRQETICETCR